MSSIEEKRQRAAYMREYYRTHPEYAAQARTRSRSQYRRIKADPESAAKERARHRDKFHRLKHRWKRPINSQRVVYCRRWRQQNPIAVSAHNAVARAVRDGRLKVPSRCEGEGCRKRRRVEAHHEDYSRPLDVTWLCSECHGLTRRK